MWQIITISFIAFILIFGLTELIRQFWLYLMRPTDDPPRIMIIFLKDDIAVQQLRSAAEYLSWEGSKTFFAVAAIDIGLKEETKTEVLKIINNRTDMLFGEKELVDFLNDINV